jgi:nitroreductase
MTRRTDRDAFYRVARSRRSVRSFQAREIPHEVLERILETGRRSASAANRQPWIFLVARRREGHPLYSLLAEKFRDAPVLLAGLADTSRAWVRRGDGVNFAWVDVTIALTEMILAATAEGVGSCWVAAVDVDGARRTLGLPAGVDLVSLVVLGYPREPLTETPKDRRGLDEVVRRGSWSA